MTMAFEVAERVVAESESRTADRAWV